MSSVALAAPTSESHCGDQAARNSRDVRFECVCVYPARPFQAYTHDKIWKNYNKTPSVYPIVKELRQSRCSTLTCPWCKYSAVSIPKWRNSICTVMFKVNSFDLSRPFAIQLQWEIRWKFRGKHTRVIATGYNLIITGNSLIYIFCSLNKWHHRYCNRVISIFDRWIC